MKNQILLVILVLLMGSLSAIAEDSQLVDRTIRLGMISPLSGDWAAYGGHVRRGIELAQKDLEAKGIKTKIFFEDACLAVQARGAIAKLILVNHIEGLVGSYCVVGMVPSAALVEEAKVVSFHTSVVPQEMLDSGEYVFTTNARIGDEGNKLAE